MRVVKVSLRDLGKLEKSLGAKVKISARHAHAEAAAMVKNRLVEATRVAPPASANGKVGAVGASGAFIRSWRYRLDGSTVHVFNEAPHAEWVEEGRRPGRPPPSGALVDWVRKVLRKTPTEARSIAFLIARAIGQRGLRPRKILARSMPMIRTIVRETVERYYKAAFDGAKAK